jgi:hypothetical protein
VGLERVVIEIISEAVPDAEAVFSCGTLYVSYVTEEEACLIQDHLQSALFCRVNAVNDAGEYAFTFT